MYTIVAEGPYDHVYDVLEHHNRLHPINSLTDELPWVALSVATALLLFVGWTCGTHQGCR